MHNLTLVLACLAGACIGWRVRPPSAQQASDLFGVHHSQRQAHIKRRFDQGNVLVQLAGTSYPQVAFNPCGPRTGNFILSRLHQVLLQGRHCSGSRTRVLRLNSESVTKPLPPVQPLAWHPSRAGQLRLRMAASAKDVEVTTVFDVLRVAKDAGSAASAIVKARLGADVIKSKASRGDLLTEVDGLVQELIEDRVREAFPSHGFLGEESVPAGAKASAEALDAAMQASASDWLWICDPIDGTTNFVQSLPLVGISIGVARRVKPSGDADHNSEGSAWELVAGVIVDPFEDEIFSASAGGGAFLNGKPIRVGDEQMVDAVVATGFAPNAASLGPMVRGISAVGARARTVRMLGSAAIMLAWVACGRLSAYFEADLNAWDTAAGVLIIREAGGIVTDLAGAPFEIATRPLLASNQAAHADLQETLAEAGVLGLDDV